MVMSEVHEDVQPSHMQDSCSHQASHKIHKSQHFVLFNSLSLQLNVNSRAASWSLCKPLSIISSLKSSILCLHIQTLTMPSWILPPNFHKEPANHFSSPWPPQWPSHIRVWPLLPGEPSPKCCLCTSSALSSPKICYPCSNLNDGFSTQV